MTQKEQTRLQVLNSFLTEHIALDQAAELMGKGSRATPGASWQPIRREARLPLPMVTAAVDRPTPHPMP